MPKIKTMRGVAFKNIYFDFDYVYELVYRYVHVSSSAIEGQRCYISLDLEFQAVGIGGSDF